MHTRLLLGLALVLASLLTASHAAYSTTTACTQPPGCVDVTDTRALILAG